MTSIQWLFKELWETPKDKLEWHSILEKAKEMHKQEIIDAYLKDRQKATIHKVLIYWDKAEQYYQETFGQGITLQNNSESKGITELSNDSWEGCDGCTEQDEVMYKNGYVKGYNSAISELPKEISDEEIEKAARDYDNGDIYGPPLVNFEQGAFWYREQLKQRQ